MRYFIYMYPVVAASARACPLSVSREVTKMAQAVDLLAAEQGLKGAWLHRQDRYDGVRACFQ